MFNLMLLRAFPSFEFYPIFTSKQANKVLTVENSKIIPISGESTVK